MSWKLLKFSSYEAYKKKQTRLNHQKLELVWVNEPTLTWLIEQELKHARSVLCHGTRNGAEQRIFSNLLSTTDVIGTEISDTATQFPMTVEWDFHEPREEWKGRYDIVYSNSWDHAYDPRKAFTTWVEQCKPGGLLVLEHSSNGHTPEFVKSGDCFGASRDRLSEFIEKIPLVESCTFIQYPKVVKRYGSIGWFLIKRQA